MLRFAIQVSRKTCIRINIIMYKINKLKKKTLSFLLSWIYISIFFLFVTFPPLFWGGCGWGGGVFYSYKMLPLLIHKFSV